MWSVCGACAHTPSSRCHVAALGHRFIFGRQRIGSPMWWPLRRGAQCACLTWPRRALPMRWRCVRSRSAWPAPWPCRRLASWLGVVLSFASPALSLPPCCRRRSRWATAGRARSALQSLPCLFACGALCHSAARAGDLGVCPLPLSAARVARRSLYTGRLFTCVALPSVRFRTLAGREPSVLLPLVHTLHGGTWVRRMPRPFCFAVVRLCAHRMPVASPPGRPGSAV